jgi:hypothetical protein
MPNKLEPQKAMSTRAQLPMPNSNRIASSMTESSPQVPQHARASEFCHQTDPTRDGTKPFSRADENILKQKALILVGNKTGTVNMQFIFDLIWDHSRRRYLIALSQQEAEL